MTKEEQVDMRFVMLAIFSASLTLFVFQLSRAAIYQPENLKRLLYGRNYRRKTIKSHGSFQKDIKGQNNARNSFETDIEMLLKEINGLRIFGIKIKTMGDFYVLRFMISAGILLVFILLGFSFDRIFYFLSAAAAMIFYFLFMAALKGKISARSAKVLKELPDVIDLMASLVSAGLTLDESIYYISKNFKGSISELFAIYRISILEGKSRAEAFSSIGSISFCTEFKSFIKVLHQSEVIGNPVKNILVDLSRVYRNNQRDFLKMRAERMESNLIVVIFMFIFIPMLMIFLLPAIPQLRLLFG